MNRRYRKTIIAGNWKMNMTVSEMRAFAEEIKTKLPKAKWCEIVLCVPAVNIYPAVRAFRDAHIRIAAQNLHYEEKGAYTGEWSAPMLRELGLRYVVIGHSERRKYWNETDIDVNKKAAAALAEGLHPIICVGESEEQRAMGITNEVIALQVATALAGLGESQVRKVIFAYEPLWAIGTGKTATAFQAECVNEEIRTLIRRSYGARTARSVSILYGGSMNSRNAAELLAQPDVDGGLIGGASLKVDDFIEIINAANQD